MEKIPEFYTECEFFLISALLYQPKYWAKVGQIVKPEYFYNEVNRKIWNKMVELKTFDTRMIIKELEGQVDFKTIMQLEGISIDRIITEFEVEKFAWLVIECYKRTEINKLKDEINSENLQEISNKITEISQLGEFEQSSDASQEFQSKIDRLCKNQKDERIIPTGFSCLDNMIEGFRKSELVILGGRPGSGKTTLAVNIACNVARKHRKVLFFSLEMSGVELHERLVTSLANIKPSLGIDVESAQKIIEISERVKNELPLTVDDRASLTVEDIYIEVKKAKELNNVDLVVIDHLSILKSKKLFKSRYEEVSDISRQLKVIAKEMDVPILCLCQLNRAVEGRELKAPTMADLRDSGSIEQDADLIFFVYRPEYYIRQREPDDIYSTKHIQWQEELDKVKGTATIVLGKNRRGETGNVSLLFNGKYYKFTEYN